MNIANRNRNLAIPHIGPPKKAISQIALCVLGGLLLTPFLASLSVTRAKEIPARNRKSGAGNVPPSCEYMKNVVFRTSGDSHAS